VKQLHIYRLVENVTSVTSLASLSKYSTVTDNSAALLQQPLPTPLAIIREREKTFDGIHGACSPV